MAIDEDEPNPLPLEFKDTDMKVSLLKVDKSLLKKSSDPITPSLEKGYKIYEYENLKAGDINIQLRNK